MSLSLLMLCSYLGGGGDGGGGVVGSLDIMKELLFEQLFTS